MTEIVGDKINYDVPEGFVKLSELDKALHCLSLAENDYEGHKVLHLTRGITELEIMELNWYPENVKDSNCT